MFAGIDLGTSSVKVLIVDEEQKFVAETSAPIQDHRIEPPISEQNPASWVAAIETVLDRIASEHPGLLGQIEAIGLSGHMHGAVLLDAAHEVLRPCILWNDGRSEKEAVELDQSADFRGIGGNLVMAGFTAPKLRWVAKHEPEIFAKIHKVLLPKDYVRFWLSGECASDMSDSAGTLWLDVARRAWSKPLLDACQLTEAQMPLLCEGSEATGALRAAHCERWGFKPGVVIAGGAGDNAAAACGMGIVTDGAFVSLGTSGVVFAPTASFMPRTEHGVHAFCHATPNAWHQMGVILSAASCLEWLASITRMDVEALLRLLPDIISRPSSVGFLPHLTGVRTPHNDPSASAMVFGLTSETGPRDLIQSVLESVGFALNDCFNALSEGGVAIPEAYAVGGGSRSDQWLQIIANISGLRVLLAAKGEYGAALGAARLAIAAHGGYRDEIFSKPRVNRVFEPEPELEGAYAERYALYRQACLFERQLRRLNEQ